MSDVLVIPWRWVTPLEEIDESLQPLLARLDAYRDAWEEFIAHSSPEEFAEARQQSLRRHAIETGIIERLYDVSLGVTEALVAEGVTREVVERVDGELDDRALTTITTQLEALEFLSEAAREERDLSVSLIKQLHVAITRNQATYDARDALGNKIQPLLRHGQWKLQPNHVQLENGSLLQYTPPDHVDAEMERLVDLYTETPQTHPLVRAAWLHHRFIGIHPFEDGNGRVARALVLLVLLGARWAPLVVDRTRRSEYLSALDAANTGDPAPLVRLFADLERIALVSELQRPRPVSVGSTVIDVARGYADRLRAERIAADQARAEVVWGLAAEIQERLMAQLTRLGDDLKRAFGGADPDAHASVVVAAPPDPRARFWTSQLVRAAKATNFYANIHGEGSWWVRLRLKVLGQELRYVVATQKVGHGETGVLAVTTFAELVPPKAIVQPQPQDDDEGDARAEPTPLFMSGTGDIVTLSHAETVDDRWQEICELVERTLTVSVAEFGLLLG